MMNQTVAVLKFGHSKAHVRSVKDEHLWLTINMMEDRLDS